MREGTDGSVVHWPTVRQESERRYCRRTGSRHHVDTERSRGWRGEGRRSRSRGEYRVARRSRHFCRLQDHMIIMTMATCYDRTKPLPPQSRTKSYIIRSIQPANSQIREHVPVLCSTRCQCCQCPAPRQRALRHHRQRKHPDRYHRRRKHPDRYHRQRMHPDRSRPRNHRGDAVAGRTGAP